MDDVWDCGKNIFLPWVDAQSKFNLNPNDEREWEEIIRKLVEEWREKLEEDSDITYPGKWLSFYEEGKEDPAVVIRCVADFTPPCLQLHNLILPIPTKCYTIGTYSRCLREWEHPEGEVKGIFHEVKIIHINRGPKRKKKGRERRSNFFLQ